LLAPVDREVCWCGWVGMVLLIVLEVSGLGWAGLVLASGLAVGVSAGVLGSSVSGRSQCRVAAFSVSGLRELAHFFSTVSHCAWRRVISEGVISFV